MKIAVLASALTLALTPLRAAPTRDPASLVAGQYTVDPDHTQVVFTVMHMGFTAYYGLFSGVSGTLDFTPRDIADMRVAVSVPVASVFTTSAKLTGELRGSDWLDAARYPVMSFRSTAVRQTGPAAADVAGTLTLHGVTRPLTLHATFNGGGVNPLTHTQNVGFQLAGSLARSDYGVGKYVPLVGDTVSLAISAAFQK